jgi:hypothetical protein
MAKALIRVGYNSYVMDADKALMVAQAVADAEQFERVYVPGEQSDTGKSHYAYYVWDQDSTDNPTHIELLNENIYRMAKLAGKPVK